MAVRMAMAIGLGISLLGALAPAPARAEGLNWIVLPVQSERPPPGDPTLLRITMEVAHAVRAAVGGELRVLSRDQRDVLCAVRGHECPDDVANLAEADRVVSFQLSKNYAVLEVKVFKKPSGLLAESKIDCTWIDARAQCDEEGLRTFLSGLALRPLETAQVDEAFAALRGKLAGCRARGGGAPASPKLQVTFRLKPDGRATDVRIEPRDAARQRIATCMARVVEALEVPPFAPEGPATFRFDLE